MADCSPDQPIGTHFCVHLQGPVRLFKIPCRKVNPGLDFFSSSVYPTDVKVLFKMQAKKIIWNWNLLTWIQIKRQSSFSLTLRWLRLCLNILNHALLSFKVNLFWLMQCSLYWAVYVSCVCCSEGLCFFFSPSFQICYSGGCLDCTSGSLIYLFLFASVGEKN